MVLDEIVNEPKAIKIKRNDIRTEKKSRSYSRDQPGTKVEHRK
jgi:hypothetical protein